MLHLHSSQKEDKTKEQHKENYQLNLDDPSQHIDDFLSKENASTSTKPSHHTRKIKHEKIHHHSSLHYTLHHEETSYNIYDNIPLVEIPKSHEEKLNGPEYMRIGGSNITQSRSKQQKTLFQNETRLFSHQPDSASKMFNDQSSSFSLPHSLKMQHVFVNPLNNVQHPSRDAYKIPQKQESFSTRPSTRPRSLHIEHTRLKIMTLKNLSIIRKLIKKYVKRQRKKREQDKVQREWRIAAKALDRVFFLVYLFFTFLFFIAFFPRSQI